MPEYVLLTVALLITAALLFVYVRRRLGPWPAVIAGGPAALPRTRLAGHPLALRDRPSSARSCRHRDAAGARTRRPARRRLRLPLPRRLDRPSRASASPSPPPPPSSSCSVAGAPGPRAASTCRPAAAASTPLWYLGWGHNARKRTSPYATSSRRAALRRSKASPPRSPSLLGLSSSPIARVRPSRMGPRRCWSPPIGAPALARPVAQAGLYAQTLAGRRRRRSAFWLLDRASTSSPAASRPPAVISTSASCSSSWSPPICCGRAAQPADAD